MKEEINLPAMTFSIHVRESLSTSLSVLHGTTKSERSLGKAEEVCGSHEFMSCGLLSWRIRTRYGANNASDRLQWKAEEVRD